MLAALAVMVGGSRSMAAPVTLGRLAEPEPFKSELEGRGMPADSLSAPTLQGNPLTLGGPVDPAEYTLGPGDLLALENGSAPTASYTVLVDAEGSVYFPDLGRRLVAGQTLQSVRANILQDLHKYLPRARLELRLLRPRSFKVFLVGETGNPGAVIATAANRAVEALSQRGSLLKTSSLRNITIQRRSGSIVRVDLQSYLNLGDQSHNPWLGDGDRILIPRQRELVFLNGSFDRPGPYEIAPGDSLSTLFRISGGLLPGASRDSVLLVRFRGTHDVDSTWFSVADAAGIVPRPDDRVFAWIRGPWHPMADVFASGEVRLPGAFPAREGRDRLSDLIRWVGGFTPDASLRNAMFLRDSDNRMLEDPDLDRLRRLTRAEMTESEYHDLKMRTEGHLDAFQIDLSNGPAAGSLGDFFLRNGDRLIVQSAARTVRVGGEVKRPGLIAHHPAFEVSDYLDLAGGFTPRADGGSVRVIRAGDGQSVPAKEAGRLSPGDYLWVPEKASGTPFWSVFKDVIAVTAQIATIYLVIKK